MFKDIRLYVNDDKINYEYKVDNDRLIINTITKLEKDSILEIFYDENVYEINLNQFINYRLGKNGEIFFHLNDEEYSFSVHLKDNFFVKSVYEFVNNLKDKEDLINNIKLFINSKSDKKNKNELNKLLELIENKEKDLEELLLNNDDEYERISNLLLNNSIYLDIVKNMTDLERMLLITAYIFMYKVPEISQDKFEDLVMIAENYDNSLENIWRLGMNYDQRGYNFDLLDKFFVSSKDVWYLEEYISGIIQVDKEKIVDKIIETKDKEFIKNILENNNLIDRLTEEQKQKLKNVLK